MVKLARCTTVNKVLIFRQIKSMAMLLFIVLLNTAVQVCYYACTTSCIKVCYGVNLYFIF